MKSRKIIDERGRLFGKISVIDVAVILIIAVMGAAYYLRTHSGGETKSGALVSVEYQLTVREVRQGTVDLLRVGDAVYDEHGANLGVIESVGHTPAQIKSARLDGSYADAKNEGRFDVAMAVSAQCAIADGHIFADRKTELAIGNIMPIITKYVKTSATVTDIY
jgi:hypothetical protein